MRLATHQTYQAGLRGLLEAQANLTQIQEQISTGKRIETPADDPVASSQIIALDQQLALLEQYRENANSAENRLNLEENVLSSVGDVLQRVRELTVQSGNAALSFDDRRGLAAEFAQRVDELMGLINTRGANNEYLFSGYQADKPPFVRAVGGGFNYQGDSGQLFIQISSDLTVAANDSGRDIFVDIDAPLDFTTTAAGGNTGSGAVQLEAVVNQDDFDAFHPEDAQITFSVGASTTFSVTRVSDGTPINGGTPPAPLTNIAYTPGEPIQFAGLHLEITGAPDDGDSFTVASNPPQKIDMLQIVENLAIGLDTLGDNASDRIQMEELISDSLLSLDNALGSVLETRAKIGGRLNTIEDAISTNQDLQLISQQTLANIQDLDYNEALSLLSQSSFTLQAAQQSYVSISNLSLFNFIR